MQNWNDILEYIKINLGGQINLIELSDDDMVKMLKNQVLSFFSQYSPDKKYVLINSNSRLESLKGQPQFRYNIPIDKDEYIIDIFDIYITSSETLLNTFAYDYMGAIDTVMANTYIDAIKSLQVRNTWEYRPPREILFDQEISAAIVVYNVPHKLLETVKPDVYHIMFKPLCLANIKLWIASMRSKYQGLQTPFGTIELNWQQLQQEGLQEKEKIEQMLMSLPPDKLIEISV